MAWDNELSGEGLKVAGSNNRRIRVMAGPGTGKSYTLMCRVARLLEVEKINPQRVLAVTFTRTAAHDLITELNNLNIPGCDKIDACTLHKFCYRLLLKNEVFEFLGRRPRPLLAHLNKKVYHHEIKPLLHDLIKINATSGQREGSESIRAYEAAWARLQAEDPGFPISIEDQKFQKNLLSWLKFHECMLIGEVVPEALRFLKNNPTTEILKAYDHILIDEYQDLNKAEQELIDILAKDSNLIIVGDEDQSIYSFRHAHPEGIIEFDHRHEDLEDGALAECRRCPPNIVDLSNNLILKNYQVGSTARLTPFPGKESGYVKMVQWSTMNDEIKGIASLTCYLVNNKGLQPKEILILTSRKEIGYEVRNVLKGRNIPVHCFYNEAPVSELVAQENLCLLNLFANNYDRASLRFWLGSKRNTWLANQYNKLRYYCADNGESPFDALVKASNGEGNLDKIPDLLKRFKELQDALSELANLDYRKLIDRLFPENVEGTSLLREMALKWLDEYEDNNQGDEEQKIEPTELAQYLRSNISNPELPEDFEYVRVMSLHKSKGLTSRAVIIGGCVQGIIPSVDLSKSQNEIARTIEEQRRLFYVALTRATKFLIVSSFAKLDRKTAKNMSLPTHGGNKTYGNTIASDFLTEMGSNTPITVRGSDWEQDGFQF